MLELEFKLDRVPEVGEKLIVPMEVGRWPRYYNIGRLVTVKSVSAKRKDIKCEDDTVIKAFPNTSEGVFMYSCAEATPENLAVAIEMKEKHQLSEAFFRKLYDVDRYIQEADLFRNYDLETLKTMVETMNLFDEVVEKKKENHR